MSKEEPVRILNLFTVMNRGGAETMVMNYYRNIDRTKIQFDFMVHRQERGAYDDEIEALGGRIYRMCPVQPQYFHHYKKLLKKFFNEHHEYKIIHSHMSEMGYFVFKEAKKHGIDIRICHCHSARGKWSILKAKNIFRRWFVRKIQNQYTIPFTCSLKAGKTYFKGIDEKEMVLMPNAVDSSLFAYNEEIRNEVRKELKLENKLVIGNVASFVEVKNHTFIIDILNEMVKINKNVAVAFVGDGQLEETIKQKVNDLNLQEYVLFLGRRSDVARVLQAFDILLMPSKREGLPVSLIEAQAAGLPCFASDVITDEVSVTELVTYKSLNDSALDWAKAILDTDISKRKNTNTDIIRSGYDVKYAVKWLEDYYLKCLNK